jgi:hypothetical protein
VKVKLVIVLYLGLWIYLGILLVPLGTEVGIPAWVGVIAAYATFFFVTGSLAYLLRSVELKRQGQTAPRYLNYLFHTPNIHQPILVPALVRLALGLVVLFGGGLFVFAGGVLMYAVKGTGALIAGAIVLSLGLVFAYVGYRVIRMNRPARRLFGADREPPLPNTALQPTPNGGAAERPR